MLPTITPLTDLTTGTELLTKALAPTHQLGPQALADSLTHSLAAYDTNRLVGVVGYHPGPYPAITALAVAPTHRRSHVATKLINAALARLTPNPAGYVRVGGEGNSLWPGVPTDLPSAQAFFATTPWRPDPAITYDLILTSDDFTPAPPPNAITFATASTAMQRTLCAATPEHWPASWAQYYAQASPQDLLVAVSWGQPVGTLIMGHPDQTDRYLPSLGSKTATIACVGTFNSVRNQGIGTALVSEATSRLFEKGATTVHIGWTALLGFYGRLGYHPWASYTTGRFSTSVQ